MTILRRNGFVRVGQSGSHEKWRNPATARQVIVAYHKGRVLPVGMMQSIVAGSGIPLDEWNRSVRT
jgi:predicted RNA binding protein YcfA (HicA-like mRNA interferase family)